MKFLLEALAQYRMTYWFRSAVWVACTCTVCSAAAMQADSTSPPTSHQGPTQPVVVAPATSDTRRANSLGVQTQAPGSSSNASERPAKINLKNGLLTVESNNSDLGQILKEITAISGMTVEGAIRSVRVFGNYGPGDSREVLTDLLRGLGYNFMMVGITHDGTPRELDLTPQSGGSGPIPSPPSTSAAAQPQQNPVITTPDDEAPGPGAILHVPPAGPDNPQDRVQQNLQRLRDMHTPQRPQQR